MCSACSIFANRLGQGSADGAFPCKRVIAMEVFKNIVMVILSPRDGWSDVNAKGIPTGQVLASAFYPLLAVTAITAFVPMIYDHTITIEQSLMDAIALFSSFFFTYFITNFLLAGFYPELVKTKGAETRMNDYILYNLIFLVILQIIKNILPIDFTPIFFLMLFMPWIAHRGIPFLGLQKEKETNFLIFSASLMLFTPLVIRYLIGLLIM